MPAEPFPCYNEWAHKEAGIMKTFIFDLDGVIVDTAKYHFLAWKKLADELGIDFTHEHNEQLKGVSRVRSLEIILELGEKEVSKADFETLLTRKNERSEERRVG